MNQEPSARRRCAFYGRVSQPSQKLEHQRSAVFRYCEAKGIEIPPNLRFEDKGGRRHKSEKREAFQRLLTECRAGKLDWVLIAAFDRWGVKDTDEFFSFRSELRSLGVRLWSVQDELELTGCEDQHYWQIIGKATAATAAMRNHAERNIGKMIDMALNGWHGSGNHAYGLDLLCCRLSDRHPIYRLHLEKNVSRTNRTYKVFHFKDDGVTVEREETVKRMPSRNPKETGYRLVPSIDKSRIEAVRQIYQLGAEGLNSGQISDVLYSQGVLYFGKQFGANGVDAILRNPAYIGYPAWGKVGVGYYRQALQGRASAPPERRPDESQSRRKAIEDRIVVRERMFDPLVEPKLFEQVQLRLAQKPTIERPRRRDRRIHPLNGLVHCPDCGSQMVNSQATNRQGETVYYFTCGLYSRTRHKECRANSVAHTVLDKAAADVLNRVESAISLEPSKAIDALENKMSESLSPLAQAWNEMRSNVPKRIQPLKLEGTNAYQQFVEWERRIIEAYEAGEAKRNKQATKRIAEIDARINELGDTIERVTSPTLKSRWNAELDQLEAEKRELQQGTQSALDRYRAIDGQRGSLLRRIQDLRKNHEAELWEQFVGRVEPVLNVQTLSNGKDRSKVVGFRFTPRNTASELVGSVLEIDCNRKDKDLRLRRA